MGLSKVLKSAESTSSRAGRICRYRYANSLKSSMGDRRTDNLVAVFLMGEEKFLAGDGRKEVRSRLWRLREWRSERSDFPRCGGEEISREDRREKVFIYGQLFRVDCSIQKV
jgi:hypothetical protein